MHLLDSDGGVAQFAEVEGLVTTHDHSSDALLNLERLELIHIAPRPPFRTFCQRHLDSHLPGLQQSTGVDDGRPKSE
eukprot:2128771-Pyramimonas_sp.AAC.1